MIDVSGRFGAGKRREMKAQAHALRKLLQLGRIELFVEFRLSRKDDAQGLLLGGFYADNMRTSSSTGDSSLRLIDDQQHFAPVDVLFDQELIQGRQHFRLLHVEREKPNCTRTSVETPSATAGSG